MSEPQNQDQQQQAPVTPPEAARCACGARPFGLCAFCEQERREFAGLERCGNGYMKLRFPVQ